MSSTNNEKLEISKDQTNFLHLCKDLFKYIKRKIIKGYVCPEFPNPEATIPNPWSYINKQETLTEKDKCCDMFKDDTFLPLVQKCYEALENIIKRMDENRKNVEFMKKNIEVGEKKIKLLSELSNQLNSYFNIIVSFYFICNFYRFFVKYRLTKNIRAYLIICLLFFIFYCFIFIITIFTFISRICKI